MHALYRDILERIPEKPKWWDENGVPRYCEFSPDKVADVHAREAALVVITTQNGPFFRFKVAICNCGHDTLADGIRPHGSIGYGDPPRQLDPEADGSMAESSEALEVLQYWRREAPSLDWVRDRSLEVKFSKPRYDGADYTEV